MRREAIFFVVQGALFKEKCGWGVGFLEKLAEKTMQWQTIRDESLGARINRQIGSILAVADTTYIYTRFVVVENMLKVIVLS